MKSIFIRTLFIISLFAVTAQAETQTRFFSHLHDVPVMPGLEELEEQALIFDKPGGRIVESIAAGRGMKAQEIYRFYAESLPQLGWRRIAENAFVRGDERMVIYVEAHENFQLARFSVQPRETQSIDRKRN